MTEEEYVEHLEDGRRRFAWVMQHHGDLTPAEAEAAALKQYPYQPPEAPYRWLIFHDHAWHWAMLKLHGELYWTKHPELLSPPPEYSALS